MGKMKEIYIESILNEDYEREYLHDQIFINEYYLEDTFYIIGKNRIKRKKNNRHYGKIKYFRKRNTNIIY